MKPKLTAASGGSFARIASALTLELVLALPTCTCGRAAVGVVNRFFLAKLVMLTSLQLGGIRQPRNLHMPVAARDQHGTTCYTCRTSCAPPTHRLILTEIAFAGTHSGGKGPWGHDGHIGGRAHRRGKGRESLKITNSLSAPALLHHTFHLVPATIPTWSSFDNIAANLTGSA